MWILIKSFNNLSSSKYSCYTILENLQNLDVIPIVYNVNVLTMRDDNSFKHFTEPISIK